MLTYESPDAFPNFIFFIAFAIPLRKFLLLDFSLYQSQYFDPMLFFSYVLFTLFFNPCRIQICYFFLSNIIHHLHLVLSFSKTLQTETHCLIYHINHTSLAQPLLIALLTTIFSCLISLL